MNKKIKTFLLNSIILASSSIIFRIIAIFFTGFITQKIGKELLGTFNLVMSVYIFGITLGNFSISFAVTRIVSEELAIGNKECIKKLSQKCILFGFICGIITSIIFIIFDDFIINICLHGKTSKNVIYIICLALPFISMSSAINGYFVAIRRVYKTIIADFLEQIIKIFVTVFFINLFLPNGLEYACFALVLGDLVSEIFSFICDFLLYYYDSKKYKTLYSTKYPLKFYIKKIFKISTPVAITSFIRSGLSTIKQILIPISFEKNKLTCTKALSTYGEINGMVMPIIMFPNIIFASISTLFIPEFAEYNIKKSKEKIVKAIKIIFYIMLPICILISIFLVINSKNIAKLIYNDMSITTYIKILSPLTIFIILDCVVDNILKGLNAQNSVMIINILDTLSDVILIYTIVPKFGISGYIFSIYFSEIVNFILSIGVLAHYFSGEFTK